MSKNLLTGQTYKKVYSTRGFKETQIAIEVIVCASENFSSAEQTT